MFFDLRIISYQYLKGKPGITNAFNVEEGYVRIGLCLVQKPAGSSVRSSNCHIPDNGHPHIRMGLQAERQDRDADEEHRNHANSLKFKNGIVRPRHYKYIFTFTALLVDTVYNLMNVLIVESMINSFV